MKHIHPLRTKLAIATVVIAGLQVPLPSSRAVEPATVAAIAAAVKSSANVVMMAFDVKRSATISIVNATPNRLVNPKIHCAYGSFVVLPPSIDPVSGELVVARKAAKGLYGTAGVVTYDIGTTGRRLAISWSNPFSGSNHLNLKIIDKTVSCDAKLFDSLEQGKTTAGAELNKELGYGFTGHGNAGNAIEAQFEIQLRDQSYGQK